MSDVLSNTDTATSNPIPVLYQSGYLTIKGYDRNMRIYTLGFPNEEVERGFLNFLLPYYTPIGNDDKAGFLSDFAMAVNEGRPEDFLLLMQTMLAGRDYRIAGDAENTFKTVLTDIPALRIQCRGGTGGRPRPHGHHHPDEGLHLYHRVEARQDRRRSPAANQEQPLCPFFPNGCAQALPDRRELLVGNADGGEVDGGRAIRPTRRKRERCRAIKNFGY